MKVRLLKDITNYAPVPEAKEMLKLPLWDIGEAVCTLTKWPDRVYRYNCSMMNLQRDFIYLPAPSPCQEEPLRWHFDPNSMGTEFRVTLEELKKSKLPSHVLHLGEGWIEDKFILFNPQDVILWALLQGIILPKGLQEAIGIRLIERKKDKSIRKKIRIKVISQFLRERYPRKSLTFYHTHEWMNCFVSINEKAIDPYRTIRNADDELRTPNPDRTRGNLSEEARKKERYIPRPIQEVISIENAEVCYHIPSLQIAMETAAFLVNLNVKNCPISTPEEFLEIFMKNAVVALYIDGAPQVILNLIQEFALQGRNALFMD